MLKVSLTAALAAAYNVVVPSVSLMDTISYNIPEIDSREYIQSFDISSGNRTDNNEFVQDIFINDVNPERIVVILTCKGRNEKKFYELPKK